MSKQTKPDKPTKTKSNRAQNPASKNNKSKKSSKQNSPNKPTPRDNPKMSSSTQTTPKTVKRLDAFKTQGIRVLETYTKDELNHMIHVANKQYHAFLDKNSPPTLTDHEFDIVKEYVEKKHPDAPALQEIGAEIVHSKQKTKLPVNMPSMDKIKPDTNALDTWMKKYKGPYVLSCKLDGVSGLYYTMDTDTGTNTDTATDTNPKLYTRGDGTIGQDVSKLLKHIEIPNIPNVIIRGEFIISKKAFETKYKTTASNIRNMVAGVINKKTVDPKKTSDIVFVAYEVIHPVLTPSKQMEFLKKHKFNTVQHETRKTITNQSLSDTLVNWRNLYEYEIDGVIVADDNVYKRTDKNPKHAFAFKMVISDQMAETQVTDVIWSPSKDGYLKPRVRINPVYINGVKIEYATGFNGQFIQQNKIGIGAVVQIIRSGDVIPYIKAVTVPASTPKMPTEPYTWTDTQVDVLLTDKDNNETVVEKQMTQFFTGIEVEGLSTGNVKRLMKAGYNSISKVVGMCLADFSTVEGFQETMAKKIHTSLHKQLEQVSLPKLLAAANTMGRGMGERKIKPILAKYPDIWTWKKPDEEKRAMLQQINGIGKENASMFVENIPKTLEFLRQCNLMYKLKSETNAPTNAPTNHPLYQKKIVFTGFRDKQLMTKLEEMYQVTFPSTITKNVYMVVVKSHEENNKKIDRAKELSIPIKTVEEFTQLVG